jgi:hypothetical protein
MRIISALLLLVACGGSSAPEADSGVPAANINGCWNYTLGSAAGAMHIDGSVGDFSWNAQPPSGSILRADEPDGLFVLHFYCHTIDCGLLLVDGGIKPKNPAPDAGDPDTRFLFAAEGHDPAHATSDAGAFTMATAACPP